MTRLACFAASLALLFAPAADAAEGKPSETVTEFGPVKVGSPMPTFAGYDNADTFVRSKQYVEAAESGLIVSFFATWCGPCRQGMPIIEEKVNSTEGWKVVFVDLGEDPAKVAAWLRTINVTSPVVFDQGGMIAKRYGVGNSLPKTFLMKADGTVATIFTTEGADFAEKLAEAMAKTN